MLLTTLQERPSSVIPNPITPETLALPMRIALLSSPLTLLHSLPLSRHRSRVLSASPLPLSLQFPRHWPSFPPPSAASPSPSTAAAAEDIWDFSLPREDELFKFEDGFAAADLRHLDSVPFQVKELDELPEEWRRMKLAWICKELPAHRSGTFTRMLNAQRKWIRQEDATYVVAHCMRIRENEAGFRVYKWMMLQPWFRFDFALSSKLADYMGKERRYSKCRDIFDDIINQGRVPTDFTFHVLIVAYLSAPGQGCVDEACSIYNRMIQLGGYQPRLSLHNSLFRALVSKPGEFSKHYLKQAEFIFHNLVTSGLEIHKDIYCGLIWLHSYQDTIDKGRIATIRREMQKAGIQEGSEVLVSFLRACSKEGDVEEAEKTWLKLLHSDSKIPSRAFVYKMEVYAKGGEPMKSLVIFREMQDYMDSTSDVAYGKIIEVLCRAQEIESAECLMKESLSSCMSPSRPSFINLMNMYFNASLHDKVESTFFQCLDKCRPNRIVYSIYMDSLVKSGNLDKAEDIFNQMVINAAIGVSSRSCNTILAGYLSHGDYVKAQKIYDLMCQKKFDIEFELMEKLNYVQNLSKQVVKRHTSMKLSKDQREILIGLLLGGLKIESDEQRKNHMVLFEFNDKSQRHCILRRHIHDLYREWLYPPSKLNDDDDDVSMPYRFSTIPHSYFGFYADQFWPNGKPMIPKLIHRWLSPQVLAYWYMYGGHRSSSGDILLKFKGSMEDAKRVIKALEANSLDCRVKRKGRLFWVGFLGSKASWFWKLTEPYILDDLKDLLRAEGQTSEDGIVETQNINLDCESDLDKASDHSDHENL